MESLKICFCHHLSLSYYGGGEKWIIQLANELRNRGHNIEIHSLPLLLEGKRKINPQTYLEGIPYSEGWRHSIKADVTYVTYSPLTWLNFKIPRPRVGGIHSHTYWFNPHLSYGFLPNLANIANRFLSYMELRRFDAIHTVSNVYPVNHPRVYFIPNFVDSNRFKPCNKEDEFTIQFASRKNWQKGYDIFKKAEKKLSSFANIRESGRIPEREMPQFLGSGHVTLVPARVDTFGLSIIESLMCGTPVITTPLETHLSLDVPLSYASSPDEFTHESWNHKILWDDGRIEDFGLWCRDKALIYDKKSIIEKLAGMFKEAVDNATYS